MKKIPKNVQWFPQDTGDDEKHSGSQGSLSTDSEVLWDPTVPHRHSLITPIVRLLRFPRPLGPPSALLERDGLLLPILPKDALSSGRKLAPEPVSGVQLGPSPGGIVVCRRENIAVAGEAISPPKVDRALTGPWTNRLTGGS